MGNRKWCGGLTVLLFAFFLAGLGNAAGRPPGGGTTTDPNLCDNKCRLRFNIKIVTNPNGMCLRFGINTCHYCDAWGLCKPVTSDAVLPNCKRFPNENIAYNVEDCEPLCDTTTASWVESTVVSGGDDTAKATTLGKCVP